MANCAPVQLPPLKADFCAPDLNLGEISMLYIGHDGQTPFTDWTDLAEWTARLDNDALADLTKIRFLHVIGDKPLPEQTEISYSQGRTAYGTASHTVNIRVDETGTENYALLQWLEANVGSTVRIWYVGGKYLYGGASGIQASLKLGDVIPESDEELNTFNGTVKWDGNHPDRQVNPLV